MTLGLWVLPADVRAFANFESTSNTGRYSDAMLGSNIRAAERFLQKTTSRQWEAETATRLFTTSGSPQVSIPDLRSVSAIALSSAALTANSTYWLIPSRQDQGVYTAVQLRPFNASIRGYRSNPDWFDRGLDLPEMRWGYDTGIPNDLSITGDWGWSPIPEDVMHAVKVLAAFYTLRPDAVLANARTSPEGTVYDMSVLPLEVQAFIAEWSGGPQLAVI